MNSIRAYNMNLNELIRNDDHDRVEDQSQVSSGLRGIPKADNDDSSAITRVRDVDSVQIDISPIWKRVANDIDLRHATGNEVAELSSTLFEAGAISFEDHVQLSFIDGADVAEKTDFIAHWNGRQEDAIRQGAMHEELNDIIRIQSILNYVDSLRQ